VALIVIAAKQRINLFQPVILLWIGGISALIAALIFYLNGHRTSIDIFSKVVSNALILLIFTVFILGGLRKRINIFETFIEGAKQGFDVAVKIIPYLVGMLVAVSVLRTCGVLDFIVQGISSLVSALGLNTDVVPALPAAIMRPLSASASRAMMINTMIQYKPDSFQGILSCVFQGSSDTTFYVVALYFGAVNIKNTRYAVPVMLLADLAGIITAIAITYFFFH
jgi:spore maturation protein SpmB